MFLLEFHFFMFNSALFVLYYIPISFLRLYSLYRQNRPHVFATYKRHLHEHLITLYQIQLGGKLLYLILYLRVKA